MHMYNIKNVYMVNKQVNDNILYMMDNEVRDPSVQLYLLWDKWRWRMIIFSMCVQHWTKERERHTFLSIFHRKRKKSFSVSLALYRAFTKFALMSYRIRICCMFWGRINGVIHDQCPHKKNVKIIDNKRTILLIFFARIHSSIFYIDETDEL